MSNSKNDENVLVKKPHQQESWTVSQLQEFAKCVDPESGPRYFMNNYFYIQHPTKGSIIYTAFPYQEKLIDTYHKYRFSISLMPRQTGKCLKGDSCINIKNNSTNKEYRIPIGIYHEFIKATQTRNTLPDISEFEI